MSVTGAAAEMGTFDFACLQAATQVSKLPSLAGTRVPLSSSVPIWLFHKINSLGITQGSTVERRWKLRSFGLTNNSHKHLAP